MTIIDTTPAVDALDAARIAFRDDLVAAGLLVPTAAPGVLGRSGTFEAILEGLNGVLTEMAQPLQPTVLRFPPVYPRQDFETTNYVDSFPDLVGVVSTFTRGDAEHRALRATRESGEPYEHHLDPATVVLTNAICHPLYAQVAGALPVGGATYDLFGWGFRHEPSDDPMRLQSFRMREFVRLADAVDAQAYRDGWLDVAVDVLTSLGLPVRAVPANDPFFGRAGKLLIASQLLDNAKVEIVVPIYGDLHEGTAIASANCQRDSLTAKFGITTADGETAHGACLAFGMERTTLALLRVHGLDVTAWPASVRSRLGV